MTTEDQRLSEWLHEQTPDPPRAISLNQIATRVAAPSTTTPLRRRPHAGRWVAVLAAAAVVALVAALLATLEGRDHDPSPATPAPGSSQNDPAPTPRPTSPTPLSFRPWNARLIISARLGPIQAVGSSLYAFLDGDLVRIQPSTGRVLARHAVSAETGTDVVLSAGRLWLVAQASTTTVMLAGFDPKSLDQLAQYRYTVVGHEVNGPALTSTGSSTLYLGAGSRIYAIEAGTGRRTQSFSVPDGMSSVAVSPDGTRLVVATGPQGTQFVEQFDPRTGAATERGSILHSGCSDLQVTPGGYFVSCGDGMEDSVGFYPFDGSAPVSGVAGGGGIPAAASISGGIAWLGGPQEVACADPRTGHIRAHQVVNLGARAAALIDLNVIGGRLYAHYIGDNDTTGEGLVELTPPKACGLR